MEDLLNYSTLPPKEFEKSECKSKLKKFKEDLYLLQNKFYADGRFSILIILQGVDTSGKDGTIRHVFSSMNPTGIHVKSFKKPVGSELEHDFLWRIYPRFPAKSMISIFNRSYYEDILYPDVNNTLNEEDIIHRCIFINELEDHLTRNNVLILKFFLNISSQKQIEKIKERKNDLHKKWKYDKADETAPKEWKEYLNSYNRLINKCNKQPWYIIPADKRWYRNFKVAEIVLNHMQSLKLKYPSKLE